jgi:hypothetical protein
MFRRQYLIFNGLSQWLIDVVAAYPEKVNEIAIWREPSWPAPRLTGDSCV